MRREAAAQSPGSWFNAPILFSYSITWDLDTAAFYRITYNVFLLNILAFEEASWKLSYGYHAHSPVRKGGFHTTSCDPLSFAEFLCYCMLLSIIMTIAVLYLKHSGLIKKVI